MINKKTNSPEQAAIEALIGHQVACNAVMKLSKEERNFLVKEVTEAIVQYRNEAVSPWRDFVEHILAMDALTPGGSNEGWAKRLLAGEEG